MHIRAGRDGPLETIAVEHLGGVIVVGTLRRAVHVDDLDVVAKFVKHMFEVSLDSITILFVKLGLPFACHHHGHSDFHTNYHAFNINLP